MSFRSTFILAVLPLALAPNFAGAQKDELKKCDKLYGTLAVVEPQSESMAVFNRYSLGSPSALLRMMAQNSKCFLVLERGVGMQTIQQERALARGGQTQSDANLGGGQMKAADFVLTAAIQVVDNNAGGIGAALGGIVKNRTGGLIGGGMKFKDASTSILISDVRTTVQVLAAEGQARKRDFGLGAIGVVGAGVAVGGYSNTAEGKVIAASYLDNFNAIVDQVKGDQLMQARAERFKATLIAGDEVKAGSSFQEGDVLVPKIDNVKVFAEPRDGAAEAGSLKKGEDVVFLGEEKDGFVKCQGSNVAGWVKKSLMAKR